MKRDEGKIRIIPLGGLGQIGLNMTAFEYGDSIIVVDCGLSFPEDDMLGIDLVIPDVTYLEENIDRVKAFFITHGHEDHIGAIPYILQKVNVPIFATTLTMGLIAHKLEEHKLTDIVNCQTVEFGDHVRINDFTVEFIRTNHSIVDAAALAIYSPAGIVIHTGDFKVDYTPVFGDTIDLQRFAELGKRGVLALLCDSTNAERPGFTPSEKNLGKIFDNIMQEHSKNRIIVATFASNVDRVQQIINAAYKVGRKVVVEGRSMVNIIETATKLNRLNVPENTLIDIENLRDYPEEKTVIITTGSQGESMAALSRMAMGIHKKVKIGPNDTVIFSSHPIPGNEKAVTKIINELFKMGADVIFQDVHVSGHACAEEIKLIYNLTQPKYSIPVHGEYKHLIAQAKIAEELGIAKDNIFLMETGNVLELGEDGAEVIGNVPVGAILVDGLGIGDVGNSVLKERQKLAEDGIVVVVVAFDAYSGQVLAGPDLISRGFVYSKGADDLMMEAQTAASEAIDRLLGRNVSDWSKLKSSLRDSLGEFFWKKTKRRPMILPFFEEI